MRTKRTHTGYGIYDVTRQIARRHQRERELAEYPPRPPMRLTPETFPVLIQEHRRIERRPLAA